MIYNVAQLLKSTIGTTQDVDLDNDDHLELDADDAELAGPVTGHLRLNRTNQGIFVAGRAQVPLKLDCSRCLKEVTTTLDIPIREEFYPTIDIDTGLPVTTPHDDDAFPISRHHEIDTREAIRQNVLLAMPVRTLCSEDCAGLCPQCGHDLNEGPCSCDITVEDDRFSALRDLLNGSEATER